MYKQDNRGWLKHLDFILWDVFALQIAFILAYAIRGRNIPYVYGYYRYLAILLVIVDIFVVAVFNTMHNVMKRGYYKEAIQTLQHVLLVLVIISLSMFAMQSGGT